MQIVTKNMTEKTMVQIRNEGEPAFPEVDTENENSASSPEVQDEKETEDDTTQSPEGDENTQEDPEKDVPFHEHPRWKEREKNWEDRFNAQETRHQDELKSIREEFGQARKDNAEATEIPSWFGGDQDAWNEYRKWEDDKLAKAEARAIEKLKSEKATEDKAVREATEFLQSEVNTIQTDKTLNPDGLKVDQNKLLKIVLDNQLVDTRGRWNYRAGWMILRGQTQKADDKPDANEKRKNLAGALNSDSKPEKKPAPYKTNEDFRNNKPW